MFPANFQVGKSARMEEIALPGFGGGLNTVESDTTMSPTYQVTLRNFRRTASGSQEVRFGSRWFADVAGTVSGDIVDCVYFSNSIICVTEDGEIAAIDDSGAVTAIWNSVIAALLPGAPSGWSNLLDSIDFVPFRAELEIHNGVDKPLTVASDLSVTYLQDLGTGSNVDVPIGKYGCVVSNYHCVAGIPAAPTTIYVSSKGTAGTFPGDPAPNDSIAIDVGAYAPEGAPEIRGIAGFRSFLVVFFGSQSVLIKLGVYDSDGNHTPEFPDNLPSFGLLGHRCIVNVVNDIRFAGFGSVNSAKRNLFGNVDGDTLSDIIEPSYRRTVSALSDEDRLKGCFCLYDSARHDTVLYLPGGIAHVYCNNEKLKYKSWSQDDGSSWRSGCVSFLGRVFLTIGSRIFQQGNAIFAGESYRADRLLDRDANWLPSHAYVIGDKAFNPNTNKSYECTIAHVSGAGTFSDDLLAQTTNPRWSEYTGEAIALTLELPWLQGKNAMQLKQNRFISILSSGTAEFTLSAWVDNLYKDDDGNVIFDPALTTDFVGNDALGFGHDAGPYGGGRRSNDPRLFKFPVNFKTLKLVATGLVRKRLELSGITFLYARGRWRR